jgi:hypothetical protein
VRGRVARFLLPQRDARSAPPGGDRRALDHLDQLHLPEVGEQHPEQQRARSPCRRAA